ncbi:zinc finger protein 260-like isoform X2 [Chrysoperla carnea]|uniref:zinc finger protein 260-like isoform X2 n=1 Tax=Chrysoperla carnea TaxID=189513 RepID=UPI001D06F549|nr:zinc finger protein 260-like isoform X2 [Chrysoperla carnea]
MDTCAVDDFDKVCRICMKFEKTFLSITSFQIIDMIIACASVQIWENDNLPNQICNACFLQLQNAKNFKELCENSDNTFRQIIEQNNLSNNQNNFDNVKDEEFEDYADDNSIVDVKEEDIHENTTNENTLEKVKITIGYNEDNLKKLETTKHEEESDGYESAKDEESETETFTCEECNQEFKKVWILGKHMQRKHRAKPLNCSECKLKFFHPLHLKQHQELTHNPLNLTCKICNKVLKDIYSLRDHKLTHSNQKLRPCERCDESFKNNRELESHNEEVHGIIEKRVTCHICGKSVTKKYLDDHLEIHKEREKITCDKCSKTFISELTLKRHIKEIHDNERNHLCNICGHGLRTASKLRIHLLTHSNERPFACDRCEKTFLRVDGLKDHFARVHLKERNQQCSFCSRAFFNKKDLTCHIRSRHTGEKPYKCEFCDKAFIQRSALNYHLKTHSKTKEGEQITDNPSDHTCDICNKVFADISALKRHKYRHSFGCKRCNKTFKDRESWKSHIKEVHFLEKYVTCHICGKSVTKKNLHTHLDIHKDREKLTCEQCPKSFKSEITLKAHVKDIHGDQKPIRKHLCNICGHASRAPAGLRKHLLIHTDTRPYPCNRCDKAFRTTENLKKHINCVHLNNRRYQCTFCPKAFCEKNTLVHHERLHTGEKPHKCEVCDKAFAQRIALKIHMKTHSNSRENFSQSLGESIVINALKTSACKLQTFY